MAFVPYCVMGRNEKSSGFPPVSATEQGNASFFLVKSFNLSISATKAASSASVSRLTCLSSFSARNTTSRLTIGLIPCTLLSSAELLDFSGNCAMLRTTSAALTSVRSGLFCFGGRRYSIPGRICRSEDFSLSTRLMLSSIIPSQLIRIMLLYCAMISTASVSLTRLPISFVASKSRNSARSSPSCRTFVSRAAVRCLRSSMQNMGGLSGFSGGYSVK